MHAKVGIFFCIVFYCTSVSSALWVTNQKVYHIENENFLNWHDASKACSKMGMSLLSIKSEEEFFNIKDYIKSKYNRIYPYWIGAYKDNGQWKWMPYNEAIGESEFFWHAGEPNNNSGNELCIHTWEGDFDWNDNDCPLKLPYICEQRVN